MNQLTTIQQGWLKLAEIRIDLFDRLRLDELACQGELKNIENLPLEKMQSALKSAKFNLSEAKRKRMEFTRMIDDKLTSPSMEFEKRMASVIDEASKLELAKRLAIESESKEQQLHANEVALYKAHIVNEWTRIAHEYRSNLQKMIDSSYINCIKARVDVAKVPEMVADLVNILAKMDLGYFQKFSGIRLLENEQALEIFHSIDKYNPKSDLEYYQSLVAEKFQMYQHDFNSIEKLEEEDKEEKKKELKKELEETLKEAEEIKKELNSL